MIRKLVFSALVLTPFIASAQTTLPTTHYLPLELATKASQAAVQACAKDGYAVSVAVVAREGAVKVLLTQDGAGAHTGNSAQGKAFTAAAMGRDTAGLAEFIATNPANNGLRDMDSRMVIQGGGVPIKFNNVVVAGIGVGGAPTGAIDANCALEGLKAIGADL
ncbi:GlcG/HbpS family heme-binding protein [Alcaligenes endophyticus]|uniref:Heme-binding protein n=1 Tax=Alcaligenes endophyticus TaxID=1929088 RepID=A0ABT8EI27_9BURK|nr:heme-binding protein [Alcaligenes endophyticus]MCX5592743.1 heme-binding protein [Alcaligenes endophyticus]MDN4120931.1 heme-binding protein [Alcaligenes endophyticus]